MSFIRINVDGRELLANNGETILSCAKRHGIDIPTLCYDERLKGYGGCGMCVVEQEGNAKLLRSCTTEVTEGMIIRTDSEKVIASRKIVLELLLSDHTGDCRGPCVLSCPGQTDCQGYVGLIALGEYKEAAKLIREQLPFPSSIGRVCPHPCETACRRELVEEPINISFLKAFAGDYDLENGEIYIPELANPIGKKVAIIGGGPAGLTCANFLKILGVDVTIYDAMPKMGGMLRYGIPEYRLPKAILDKEIDVFKQMGIEMINNVKLGVDTTLDYLKDQYDAVVLAVGAWTSLKMNVPGEDLEGVVGGIDFLRNVSENKHESLKGKIVGICGGGNVAMDSCRTAVRLEASKVYNLYRRSKAEMPAEDIEITEAEEEGIEFKYLSNPLEFIGENNKLKAVRLQKMMLGEPDASGRRSPVPILGEEETIDIDIIIMSIGQGINTNGIEQIELTRKKTINADEGSFLTNIEGVFAIGDATNKGASIAIEAIGDAKRAANVIYTYLNGNMIKYSKKYVVERKEVTKDEFKDREKCERVHVSHQPADARRNNFKQVPVIYTEEEAQNEAKRCLECGCHDYFECKLVDHANMYDIQPYKIQGYMHNRTPDNSHPFIIRNQNKCVLCSLCVRVCDELMGICAFGLVDRGFETVVSPAFNVALQDTDCISCGQCISICPTGALGEKHLTTNRLVPLKEESTETTCAFCSVGCKTELKTNGEVVLKSLFCDTEDEKGLLCAKGKFGFSSYINDRAKNPLIKKNGNFEEVSLDEAIGFVAGKTKEIIAKSGGNSVAVSISDKLTNEEIYTIKQYAQSSINTENIFSFNNRQSVLKTMFGVDCSTSTFKELKGSDMIVIIGSDIMKNHTVAGLRVKQAVEKGAKLIVINPFESIVNEWTTKTLTTDNTLNALKEIAKRLIDKGSVPKNANGFEEFSSSLGNVNVSRETSDIADMYLAARKPLILFEQYSVSDEAAQLIASIAVITNKIGNPRSGIIQLKPNNNSQGLIDMGVSKGSKDIMKKIADKSIKELLVFGEDSEINADELELLVVFDTHITKTAEKADVFIPLVSFAETDGTFTATDRKLNKVRKTINPMTGYNNWELPVKLANTEENKVLKFDSLKSIERDISAKVSGYRSYFEQDFSRDIYTPIDSSPVLYVDGFKTEDKKAKLSPVVDQKFTVEFENSNAVYSNFILFLKEQGLLK